MYQPEHDRNPGDQQLRADAERRLASNRPPSSGLADEALLHELQVHQIELEMQNESLRQALVDIEESRDFSARLYGDLYEFAPVGYFTVTRSGLVTAVNLTGASMLGETRNRLLQTRFDSMVAAADRERWQHLFPVILAAGTCQHCELALQRKDGSLLHVHLELQRSGLEDDTPELRIAITDIEQSLRESEAKFRSLFDNSAVAIQIHERDSGEILEANHRALTSHASDSLEQLSREASWLEPPYSQDDALRWIWKVADTGAQRFEWQGRDRFGRMFWEDVQLNSILLEGQERVLRSAIDITTSKAAEATLLQQTETLRLNNAELARFNLAMVGRELVMIELKRQINELSLRLGIAPPYPPMPEEGVNI